MTGRHPNIVHRRVHQTSSVGDLVDQAAPDADDLRRHLPSSPTGIALVTGVTVGMIFTLFVPPVFYSLIPAQHQPLEQSATPDEVEPDGLTFAGARA